MKPRETSNPHNRFHKQVVAYDEGDGPPPSQITLLDDRSRSILSENDSPDLPFRYSANPYRGCQTACAYCLSGDTKILLGDGRTRPLADLEVGDEIYGTVLEGTRRRYVRTRVLDKWATLKLAYRVRLADGTELVASGDHRFLTERGWKHVAPVVPPAQRPYLTTNNSLLGTGHFAEGPDDTVEYRRGYLCGLIRGDGTLHRYDYSGRRRGADVLYQFRLALIDLEALARSRRYLADLDVQTREFEFARAHGAYAPVHAIRASSRAAFERIHEIVAFPDEPSLDWDKGFLAGIFDAEGSRSKHVLRITNTDLELIRRTVAALDRLGFDSIVETRDRPSKPIHAVRIRRGLSEHLRFFHTVGAAITRKWDFEGTAVLHRSDLRVASIEPVGLRRLFDITTGTGDFIANGVVSHNCYARPTHEYLDLGAGTDFDTKIVVKRDAPELLRAAFDKPSWRGDHVMFSGVTDCYQPIERELELTRRCLEVCLEYRNPASVISKHALVERDIDLFQELARQARFGVSVSLAWTDADLARAIEPWAPSPERRLKVIEALARAGVPVGVMAAPIIPGVNDSQLVGLLERAAAAGATSAGWVLLRLPGAVKQVFEERVRGALPLAADKILHRIRETRGGGQLYNARFHTRGRGEGPYADMIATMFDTTVARLGLNRRHRAVYEPVAAASRAGSAPAAASPAPSHAYGPAAATARNRDGNDRADSDDDSDEPTTFRRPPPKKGQLSLF